MKEQQAADIGRVYVCDHGHPHWGESGFLTGKMISVLGTPMAELRLDDCKHGTDGCFVGKGQIAKDGRSRLRPQQTPVRSAGKQQRTKRVSR